MSRRTAGLAAVVALGASALLAPSAAFGAAAPGPVAGSASGGDPYFPAAGNGGYDVAHYSLDLDYVPTTKALKASATIIASAGTALSSFNLDLRDLTVTAVTVNGRAAKFSQSSGELTVTPAKPLAKGVFVTTVTYGGTTGSPEDVTGEPYGWVSFPDGAFTGNEPEGASTWYPVNDVPYDKATYDFEITVPKGTTAVGNGLLLSEKTKGDSTTFVWATISPTASYLTSAANGNYTMTRTKTADGLPIYNAVDNDLSAARKATAAARLALQPEMISFFSKIFGKYPFESFGAVIDDDDVGYALENQTRPIYSGVPGESTIAHELAHQWYGDSVTPVQWKDIWLNEGFATYAEWLWGEHRGGPSLADRYDDVASIPADDEFWAIKVADPGALDLFADATYDRAGAFLIKLQTTIGDDAFGTVLKKWAAQNKYSNATTADLQALAEKVSGKNLGTLFTDWLYTTGKPAV